MGVRGAEIGVKRCTFARNRAFEGGGGMSFQIGNVTLTECEIMFNESLGGGGIEADDTFLLLKQCRLFQNKSLGGGAIYAMTSYLTATGCLFYGNIAETHGGAINGRYIREITLDQCTLSDNKAEHGAFISANNNVNFEVPRDAYSPVFVRNCIVRNGGQEIYANQALFTIGFTTISGDSSSFSDPDNIVLGEGNIDVDPMFVSPGFWDANGTPDDVNDDVFIVGDYHLKSEGGHWDPDKSIWTEDDVTSPCIDTGDPKSPIGLEPFPNGGRVNMGAYGGTAESSRTYFDGPPCEAIIAGDINGDCRVDMIDLSILGSHWLEDHRRIEQEEPPDFSRRPRPTR